MTKRHIQHNTKTIELNLWIVFLICFFISAIFFFLFGFNSPIFKFNTEHDYQWFMTMGNALKNGKIPYRDLFEQKGPIVYFVTAFCCLFPYPNIVMLVLEIISMTCFFFFIYRICKKKLNTFYSLLAIPLIAFAIFTSWSRIFNAATVEEFALPICAYFLLCWFEFLQEKRAWNCTRSLCLGLCYGLILWTKYTLFYFILVPMIIWIVFSLRRRQLNIAIKNVLYMLIGFAIITTPVILFFILQNAIKDLFNIYFYINLTIYTKTTLSALLLNTTKVFKIGPTLLILIITGIIYFTVQYWHERTGFLLLISFLVNFILLALSPNGIAYYYSSLAPYSIFGIICILNYLQTKLKSFKHFNWIFITLTCLLIIVCIPFSPTTKDWGRDRNDYAPLVIADVIKKYEISNNKKVNIFCYKIWDFGFYNAIDITPNNYYFVNNLISIDNYPSMYEEFKNYIEQQSSDFIITELKTWNMEKDWLSSYYSPYNNTVEESTYTYYKINYGSQSKYEFILLFKC